MEKEKTYTPMIRYEAKENDSFMEFGIIKNGKYRNTIYKRVKSCHDGIWGEHCDEMTRREAKLTIKGITEALSSQKEERKIKMPCLKCGQEWEFDEDSNEAKGIFNVFCPDKDCEDEYAFNE